MAVIDIDHFKGVNDKFGHEVGDRVLRQVAQALEENSRRENVFCRWGGEEFVALIVDSDADMAMKCVENLRKAVAKAYFEEAGHITISGGGAEMQKADSISRMFKRADHGLYAAKSGGRNCIVNTTKPDCPEFCITA